MRAGKSTRPERSCTGSLEWWQLWKGSAMKWWRVAWPISWRCCLPALAVGHYVADVPCPVTTLASSVTPWPRCAWTLELVLCRVVICFWLLESGMVKFCPSLLETGEPWPIITSWRCCSCTESRSSVSLCDAPSFEGIVAPTSRIFLVFFWSFILGQSWHLCPRQ